MFRQLEKSDSGFVLVLVLGIIAVMIILAVSIMSINVTEVMQLESLSDSIVAEELAKKYYWLEYYNSLATNEYTEVIDGKTYTVAIQHFPNPPNPDRVQVNVTY